MWNWQCLERDGIGPSLMPDSGCVAWFVPSIRLTNRQARKRGLKEFTPSLPGSALRGRLVPHRCGETRASTWTNGLRLIETRTERSRSDLSVTSCTRKDLQELPQEIPPVDLERRQVSHALSLRLMRLRRTSCLLSVHGRVAKRRVVEYDGAMVMVLKNG